MRGLLGAVIGALVLAAVTAAPAGDAEVPERYLKVDEAKAALDARKPITFVDVRGREQYAELHIQGARSIPLRELPTRLAELPRTQLVVLY